jgi:glycosyltransferase involved in cell wall biosynthesis
VQREEKTVKVVQLISSGGYYGAESMLLNLCANQEQAGCSNDLLLFLNARQPNTEFYEQAQRNGLNVQLVRCRGRLDWGTVRQIREHLQLVSADLIHTHGYKADIYGYLAARGERKPAVATCHNWLGGTASLGVYNWLDRKVLRNFSAVVAVSDGVANSLRSSGVPSQRIRTIANGVDVTAFAAANPGSFRATQSSDRQVIGMVARLDLQKGFECLLRAVSALRELVPRIHLILVGEGPDRAIIESRVRELGLQSNVTLAGHRTDMPAVYAAMEIFVLPSLNEGLPMTLLEAMASSKPVVATRVGAVPEVVRDGETGLLVEPQDIQGLVAALSRLLADADLCRRLGTQACAWVKQRYSSAAMARSYGQMYEDVVASSKKAPAPQSRRLDARGVRTGDL